MLRVIVRQARSGMTLARSVINPRQPDQTLLPTGHTLEAHTIARLHELGVYDLWVEYPGMEFLDDFYSAELTAAQQRLCESLKGSFIEQAQRCETQLPIRQYRATVEELVHAILDSAATLPFMSTLAGVDDMLLRHSCEVCVLGLMLGLRLEGYLVEQRKRIQGRAARDVVNLGMGCLLHDIGELQVAEQYRESRHAWAFDEEGGREWRNHAQLGHATVRGQLEPSAATVVLNHHQHFDGSGFPRASATEAAQSGSQIHVFSRIAMAADTFQHLLHRDGVLQPTVCALWHVQQNPVRRWFDPIVLAALMAVVPPFIPGMLVTLSDWRQAIVTKVHEDAPCYPVVQVLDGLEIMSPENMTDKREVIDLAATTEFYVQGVDGFEVESYLYGPRHVDVKRQTPKHEAVASTVRV